MASRGIEQATLEDLPEIRRLLIDVFQSEDRFIFSPEMLTWKAFDPHPFWEGGRSYILRTRGKIAAHALVVPLRLKTAGTTVRAQSVIDWVASKEAVGAGVLIYTQLRSLTDLQICLGGSDHTRRLLPRMGFSIYQTVRSYNRVIRPAAHLARVRGFRPASWLRAARDYKELLRGRGSAAPEFQAIPCHSFEPGEQLPLPDPTVAGGAVFEQTVESLNYVLRCPVPMEAYRFQFRGEPWGYCLLSRIGHQCRIVNMWVHSSRAEDWSLALTRITGLAAADPDCTEIVACAALPLLDSALNLAGFRTSSGFPFFVHNSQRAALKESEVSITLSESDAFYL